MKALWISVGGVLGANARYFLGAWVLARTGGGFPYGTLCINVAGCLCIGALSTVASRLNWPEGWRLLGITGFLGAFTTFSAFGGEVWQLATVQRQFGAAALYVLLSVALGIAAVGVGHALARAGLTLAGIEAAAP